MKCLTGLCALIFLIATETAFAQPLWWDCHPEANDYLSDNQDTRYYIILARIHATAWRNACNRQPPAERDNCNLWLASVDANLAAASVALEIAYNDIENADENLVVPLVQRAEALQLGLPIQVVPAAFIADAVATAFQVRIEETDASAQTALAAGYLSQAYTVAGNSPTLSPLARPDIQLIIGDATIASLALSTYVNETEETFSGILAAAVRNVAMNAGRPPAGAILNTWPLVASDTFYGPTNMQLADPPVTADFVNRFASTDYQFTKVENGAGETYRRVNLVYSVPAGAYTGEIRSPLNNSVVVPANTPICATWHGSSWPTYAPSTNCVYISAYFGPGYVDGDPCTIPGQPNDLRPGQSSTCPIDIRTTGTPATLGAQRSQVVDIIHAQTPGHGTSGFWRSSLTVNFKLERPKNPCYVWNESIKKWICSGGGK